MSDGCRFRLSELHQSSVAAFQFLADVADEFEGRPEVALNVLKTLAAAGDEIAEADLRVLIATLEGSIELIVRVGDFLEGEINILQERTGSQVALLSVPGSFNRTELWRSQPRPCAGQRRGFLGPTAVKREETCKGEGYASTAETEVNESDEGEGDSEGWHDASSESRDVPPPEHFQYHDGGEDEEMLVDEPDAQNTWPQVDEDVDVPRVEDQQEKETPAEESATGHRQQITLTTNMANMADTTIDSLLEKREQFRLLYLTEDVEASSTKYHNYFVIRVGTTRRPGTPVVIQSGFSPKLFTKLKMENDELRGIQYAVGMVISVSHTCHPCPDQMSDVKKSKTDVVFRRVGVLSDLSEETRNVLQQKCDEEVARNTSSIMFQELWDRAPNILFHD